MTGRGAARWDKFANYRRFDSLQTYVLVSPELRQIEVFTRADGWRASEPLRQGLVQLGALYLQLDMNDVFEGL